jgi:hypothetical protein
MQCHNRSDIKVGDTRQKATTNTHLFSTKQRRSFGKGRYLTDFRVA